MLAAETRSRWLRRGIVGAVLVILVGYAWSARGRHEPLDVGSKAPAYQGLTLARDTMRLADLHGRVVLLNVWATWCVPCVREMPALENAFLTMKDAGFTVVAVSVDNAALTEGEPQEAVQNFVREHGITFPVLYDPDRHVEDGFPVPGLPVSYLIDREGRIRGKYLGGRAWDQPQFQTEIRKLLGS